MKFVTFVLICFLCSLALSEKLAIQILLDPTDEKSSEYVRNEVSKIANTDMNHYVVVSLLPFGKSTFDKETKEITVPGDDRMREYLSLESCVAENAQLHQAVSFFNCIADNKDNLEVNLKEKCVAEAKIQDDETLQCFEDLDRALLGLATVYNRIQREPAPYFPYVLIEGKLCEDSCPDLYQKSCDFYPVQFKPYLCRIPSPKPVDVFDNDGTILAHYENPEEAPGYKLYENIQRNVNEINVRVVFDPSNENEHNFIKLFEDLLYKDYRHFTNLTFYPIGSIPVSEKQEDDTYKRYCGEKDPDCKITKHMICGNYKNDNNEIGYWSYLQCMVRHGEYMFRNVDYCASSGRVHAPFIHECLDTEIGDQLLDSYIASRNEEFNDVKSEELPVVYINKDKCINNCGDVYVRICNKIPGKLPVYCGGTQRLQTAAAPCKECRREEVMRPPGLIGSIPVEIFTDASCKWGNKFLSGPITWLTKHKRFANSVDLHIHSGMGCYVDKMGVPRCPFGAHQTTQNLILSCVRDLWPDFQVHNPLTLCFTKYFNEYEKHIDECADENNVDPQAIVDCVNSGRGVKAMERYFKRTRYQFDPMSLPAVKIQNETVYEYNKSVEVLCQRLDPVPKFCKKLPKFPKKSPKCVADDLTTWPEM